MSERTPSPGAATATQAGWRAGLGILNLRGDPNDPAFREAVRAALGTVLPPSPGGIAQGETCQVVAVGPDDWFLIGPAPSRQAVLARLGQALEGQHAALCDVSSGYRVLHLRGPDARAALAQGCPLDLHPRVFGRDRCAGSHFFRASVWLWRSVPGDVLEDPNDAFDLLVRRSFAGYVQLMMARAGTHLIT